MYVVCVHFADPVWTDENCGSKADGVDEALGSEAAVGVGCETEVQCDSDGDTVVRSEGDDDDNDVRGEGELTDVLTAEADDDDKDDDVDSGFSGKEYQCSGDDYSADSQSDTATPHVVSSLAHLA